MVDATVFFERGIYVNCCSRAAVLHFGTEHAPPCLALVLVAPFVLCSRRVGGGWFRPRHGVFAGEADAADGPRAFPTKACAERDRGIPRAYRCGQCRGKTLLCQAQLP